MSLDERLDTIESDVHLNNESALMAIGAARKDVVDLQQSVSVLRASLELESKLNAERVRNFKYAILLNIASVITLGALIAL